MPKKIFGIEYPTQLETRRMLEQKNLTIAPVHRRILAYILDVIPTLFLASAIMIPCGLAYSGFGIERGDGATIARATFLLWAWVVFPLYYALLALILGRTLGCWVLRIKSVRMSGNGIGFVYGFLRGFFIGTITALFFPFLLIVHTLLSLFDWRGNRMRILGWDAASGTIVVQEIKNAQDDH